MNKHQLMNQALNHIKDMSYTFESEIQNSIENSIVYRHIVPNMIYKQNTGSVNISLCKGTTEHVINIHDDNYCVLNFASFKYPGGGFITGAMAQEESLCHNSTLYNVISNEKFVKEYEYNRQNTNFGLYSNFAIYSPDIIFINGNNDIHYANIITCAAPNLSAYRGDINKAYETMEQRIKFILDIAENNKQKKLILGAFGCGVFKNNPEFVAHTFLTLILSGNYSFKDIIFAIPKSNNSDIFANVLFNITKTNYPFKITKTFYIK